MANELRASSLTSGATYYAVIRSGATYYNSATPGFENYNAANWANYAVASGTANSAGDWAGTFPTLAAGDYSVTLRNRAGGSPAATDPVVAGPALMGWDGAAETTVRTRGTSTLTQAQVTGGAYPLATTPDGRVDLGLVLGDAGPADNLSFLSRLDADVSSRLAASAYAAPDNADVVSALNGLVALLARTDPTTALTAVKAVTDKLAGMLVGSTPDKFTTAALSNAPADATETLVLQNESITVTAG